MSLSYFGVSSIVDGSTTISYINLTNLISTIQGMDSDSYFTSTAEVDRVEVFYVHQDGQQQKRVIHLASNNMYAIVGWSIYAHDGTWTKSYLKVYDKDGAGTVIPRSLISSSEDLTHASGVMTLNTSI